MSLPQSRATTSDSTQEVSLAMLAGEGQNILEQQTLEFAQHARLTRDQSTREELQFHSALCLFFSQCEMSGDDTLYFDCL